MRAVMALLLVACGPGVGRPAEIPDAEPRDADSYDALVFPDATVRPDAGFSDTGLFIPDSGDLTEYPFSGVFGILNTNDSLFAREVDDRLMLVVGRPPYIYTGTIDDDGNVDTASGQLTRSGCAVARVTGNYDRFSATYELRHETCSTLDGTPIDGMIRGGFGENFAGASGVYDLTATLIQDLTGCVRNNQPQAVRIGVNLLSDGTVMMFSGVDVVTEPGVYVGRLTGNGDGFSALQSIDVDGTQQFAMSGAFNGLNANDPIQLSATRDAYEPEDNCAFRLMVDGARSEAP